jgi:hypothetical protein
MYIHSFLKSGKSNIILLIVSCFSFLLFTINFVQAQTEPAGNTYSVQVLLSRTHLQPEDAMFKGLKGIEEEVYPGFYKYKYVTGMTTNLKEATQTRSKMIDAGFNGAFIVQYKHGSRITVNNLAATTTNTKLNEQPLQKESPVGETAAIKYADNDNAKISPLKGKGNAVVQTAPEFPGGYDSLTTYFRNSLAESVQKTPNGQWKEALVTFKVAKDGKIQNIKMLSGINKDFDRSILSLVRSMPTWKPGAIDGTPVDKDYTLPLQLFIEGKHLEGETAIQE